MFQSKSGKNMFQVLEDFDRNCLISKSGISYLDFRKQLTPNYYLVWTHLLLGYISLISIVAITVFMDLKFDSFVPILILISGFLIGYVLHYILAFFHEAAHYNLAKNKALSDRLANIFIGLLFGQEIKSYRLIHFPHHQYLGTPKDTERTYFEPLTVQFIIESLTGIKLFKLLLFRIKNLHSEKAYSTIKNKKKVNPQIIFGLLFNGCVVLGSAILGIWALTGAWLIGMMIFMPLLTSIQQVLEHRDEFASRDIDYRKQPHGQTNRLFGDGLVASTFGSAGFNRHLLHHWEPQISYTRFKELEDFLMDTQAATIIIKHRTTYFQAFVRLFTI